MTETDVTDRADEGLTALTCVCGVAVVLGLGVWAHIVGWTRFVHGLAGKPGAAIAFVTVAASVVFQLYSQSDTARRPDRRRHPVAVSMALLAIVLFIVAIRVSVLAK